MQLLVGIMMGITYVASPGPVNVETFRRGLRGGFAQAFALQTGSNLGRILYALLALFGVGLLLQEARLQLILGLAGAAILFYLGLSSFRSWHAADDQHSSDTPTVYSTRRIILMGMFISLMNPLAIVFWLAVGSRYLGESGSDGTRFLAGFFLGCLIMSLIMSWFASVWQDRFNPKFSQTLSFVCGLSHIIFGLNIAIYTFN